MGRIDDGALFPRAEGPLGRACAGVHVPLDDSLTWSATVDPSDDTREIEITDEMVRLAIAEIEREQVYPFVSGTAPVARPVRKADVIVFPGKGAREGARASDPCEGRGKRDGLS